MHSAAAQEDDSSRPAKLASHSLLFSASAPIIVLHLCSALQYCTMATGDKKGRNLLTHFCIEQYILHADYALDLPSMAVLN
jgi:hypothetical protein